MARPGRQMNESVQTRRTPKEFCFRTQFKSFENTAEILVGESKTRYIIHKDLLASQSPFFSAALNGNFKEGQTQTITLTDIEPKTFDHIILWLYQNRLEPTPFFFKDEKPTYFSLLDLYAIADQLDIESLRNAIVDRVAELAEKTNSVLTPTDTHILYESIRPNAPIKELILDLFAFKKTDNLIATHPDEWHPSFFRDLICKLKRPGPANLSRHDLGTWRSANWAGARACEGCKVVLKPAVEAMRCGGCGKVFCLKCVEVGSAVAVAGLDWGVGEKDCKPWLRGMCAYHEHVETEKCGK